ncbi:SUMF1/EgtB/PvdO family nonheme iron enzyme [Myxococcota bacterium]|nr:SUMF1/EgtB/PvdO family nonheme iron enzyme [Myxococcota bacterium]
MTVTALMGLGGAAWGEDKLDALEAEIEQIKVRQDVETDYIRLLFDLETDWQATRVWVASGRGGAKGALTTFIERWQAKKIPNRHEAEATRLRAQIEALEAAWRANRGAIESGNEDALRGFLAAWANAEVPNVYAQEAQLLASQAAWRRERAARDAQLEARDAQLKMRDAQFDAQLRLLEVGAAPLWITLPGGSFQMGSNTGDSNEKPVHEVQLKGFMMSKTEVTVKQYQVCVSAGVCSQPHWDDKTCFIWTGANWSQDRLPDSFRGEQDPVVCVDWNQAQAFATWVGARLPTEAEWEYAARSGGKDQAHPWGDAQATCRYAVMHDGGNGCGQNQTWSVCSKPQGNTEQGLCDMSGNAWEWVADYYGSYDSTPRDGTEHLLGSFRVFRGGGWNRGASFLRAAYRAGIDPSNRYNALGFRLARSLP